MQNVLLPIMTIFYKSDFSSNNRDVELEIHRVLRCTVDFILKNKIINTFQVKLNLIIHW